VVATLRIAEHLTAGAMGVPRSIVRLNEDSILRCAMTLRTDDAEILRPQHD
jgi:hypothetical protein